MVHRRVGDRIPRFIEQATVLRAKLHDMASPLAALGKPSALIESSSPSASDATFRPGWIAYILVRNAILIASFAGAWHLRVTSA
jgi:hypothetical protein